jgi:hypothetical protein
MDCSGPRMQATKGSALEPSTCLYVQCRVERGAERFRRNGEWHDSPLVALRAFAAADEDKRGNVPLLMYFPEDSQALYRVLG